MPVHFKGELLSGMAQSAQRTGRSDEAAQFVDKMLTVLADTPYEKMARQWKADPASAATTNLTCKNCHSPGRLVREDRGAEQAAISPGPLSHLRICRFASHLFDTQVEAIYADNNLDRAGPQRARGTLSAL